MDTLTFALVLVVLAVLLRLAAARRSEAARRELADEGLLRQFARTPALGAGWLRLGLLGLGAAAIALATGSASSEARRTGSEGGETILVLDASNSMLAEDVEPNRLEVQRRLAASLANRLPGKVGVVYFAGRGYVLSPLTTDLGAVQMFVEGVRPAAVGRGGSSIAAGLTQALDLLAGGEEEARKAIVLFSDGEETVGQSVQDALDRARDSGVRIYTVGVGTTAGAQIPLTRDASLDPATALRRRRGPAFLEGPDGRLVVSKLEAATLREIAGETGGSYSSAADQGVAPLERELGDPQTASSADRNLLVSLLLLVGFASLWGEAFLFPRG